jgi:hypothetical protein
MPRADTFQTTNDISQKTTTERINQGDPPLEIGKKKRGGRRSGTDKRHFSYNCHIPERRWGADRRAELERRCGLDRRSSIDRRSDIERRKAESRGNDRRTGEDRRSCIERRASS